jgi:ferredoxin
MAGPLRIHVDHHKCVGSTLCIQVSPAVFGLDDNRQSVVVDPAGDTRERVLEAAQECPLEAITVEETETGRRLFP